MFGTQAKEFAVLAIASTGEESSVERTHLVRDALEEIQDLQRVQIFMDCLVDIHAKFLLCFNSGGKGLLPGLHLHSCLFCAEFVVNDLQCSGFLHRTIRRGTVRTIDDLTSSSVHSFEERLALHIFNVRTTELFKIYSSIRFFQQHASASLKKLKLKREGTVED